MLRKIKQNYIVLILIFLSVLTILILQNFGFKSYSRYSTDTLHYDKGVVVEISNEDIESVSYTHLTLPTTPYV